MKSRSFVLCFLILVQTATLTAQEREIAPAPEQMEKFLKARIAADRGDTEMALNILGQLIADQEDSILYYERARILLDTRQYEEAESDLRSSIELDPALADSRRTLGRLLLDRSRNDGSRIDEALEHLTVAYQQNPNDVGTGLTIAQVYNGTGKSDRAMQVLDGLIERMPDNRSVNHQYAQVLVQLDREVEAIPFLEVVVSGEPFYEPGAAQLVELYEQTDDWEKSVILLQRWVDHQPTNIEVRKRLGFAQLRAGDSEAAVDTLAWVNGQVSGDFGLDYLYAEALTAAGRYQEAEGYYETLLKRDPSNADLQVSYAINQLQLDKLDNAAVRFRALARRMDVPESVRDLAKTQLASIAHRNKSYDEALSQALSVLESESASSQAMGIALDVYEKKGEYDSAIKLIEKRRKLFPESELLEANLFRFQRMASRDRAAGRTLSRLLTRNESSAIYALQVLGQLEQWPEAVDAGRKALKRWGGESVQLLFQFAASLERSGNYSEAVENFEKLLTLDPDHAPSQNYLGYMWAERGENLERARVLIEKAVDTDPSNGAYVDSLGWVYFRLGDLEKAERYLTDAVDLEPEDSTVREHLGDVNAMLGRLDLARENYEQAIRLEPDNPAELRSKLSDIEERIARATSGDVN